MQLIDNINHLLGDDLKEALKPGTRLKVAASCFPEGTQGIPHPQTQPRAQRTRQRV